MKSRIILPILLLLATNISAQVYKPDLQNKTQVSLVKRSYNNIEENGRKGVKIEQGAGGAIMKINSIVFSNGTVEFDAKGKNIIGGSFLGLAFHIQNDSTYDIVYFRPFNFLNPDTVRRWRAVQYVSMPAYPWDKLRQEFPGKYENKVNPVPNPDDWFHCKIVVKDKLVSVFVNNSSTASLVVEKLTNASTGGIGLWVENGSEANFANLEIRQE